MVINDIKYETIIQGESKEVNPAAKGTTSNEVLFLFGDLYFFVPMRQCAQRQFTYATKETSLHLVLAGDTHRRRVQGK